MQSSTNPKAKAIITLCFRHFTPLHQNGVIDILNRRIYVAILDLSVSSRFPTVGILFQIRSPTPHIANFCGIHANVTVRRFFQPLYARGHHLAEILFTAGFKAIFLGPERTDILFEVRHHLREAPAFHIGTYCIEPTRGIGIFCPVCNFRLGGNIVPGTILFNVGGNICQKFCQVGNSTIALEHHRKSQLAHRFQQVGGPGHEGRGLPL